ncbi:hypothetical protein VU12_05100, partial [Desulfobulbus sp. US4]|nr:hypothetical protein [Desulfobulbus sp. US4]
FGDNNSMSYDTKKGFLGLFTNPSKLEKLNYYRRKRNSALSTANISLRSITLRYISIKIQEDRVIVIKKTSIRSKQIKKTFIFHFFFHLQYHALHSIRQN